MTALIDIFLAVDDGAYLKPVETAFGLAARLDHACKLYLDGPLHLLLAFLKHKVDGLGERIDIVLENVVERHDFASHALVVVAYDIVAEVVGRHHVGERAALGHVLHAEFGDVVSVLDLNLVERL